MTVVSVAALCAACAFAPAWPTAIRTELKKDGSLQSITHHYMRTIFLLFASNIFMTIAWYGNLKDKGMPLWKAILISWGIAFFEYCLMVPANRYGYVHSNFSAFQLKIIQEVITLLVFSVFAIFYLKESFEWRYLVSFAFVLGAVYFAFKK